jgi:hypothetical protein
MAKNKYLFDSSLSAAIEDLIKNAKDKLTLISPYIDLSERVKSALNEQLNKKNPNFTLKVLFGKDGKDVLKNERRSAKQLKDSLEFFMNFPNVEIKFEKRLHAKFYLNDFDMIFSSMNLYNYSLVNNIEFGIIENLSSIGILGQIGESVVEIVESFENQISEKVLGLNKAIDPVSKFESIFSEAELLYQTNPIIKDKKDFKSKIKGAVGIESKEIVDKEIRCDFLTDLLKGKLNVNSNYEKINEKINNKAIGGIGFCIRTGSEIPFNPKKPMSNKAFTMWNKYKDVNYSEKFCHFSGEKPDAKTSVKKPILNKNWKKAKEKYNL